MAVERSSEHVTEEVSRVVSATPEPLLSFSGKVGSTFNLGVQVQLTPGASSTCTGNSCRCSSCCCW
jgi:hypothetical protein